MKAVAPLALLSVALVGCQRASDAEFGARVRAYLLAHPEVIQQASDRLQAREQAQEEASVRTSEAAVPRFRAAIEHDPRDLVANPGGRITVTEFYDYRCPHCAEAAPAVLAMIRNQPDVRFVFKEMPIFGPTSEHAARVALEVKAAGGDSLGLYRDFMSHWPLDDADIDRIAHRMGVGDAEAPTPEEDRQLADTAGLFQHLGLEGTPAFIIGDQVIPGGDMDAVSAAVARERDRLGGGRA